MDDQPIQINVSPQEARQFAQVLVDALSAVLVNCRPIDQLITVEDRCRQLWPSASARNRHRVRDVFVAIHRERLGRHPLKLTGHLNGTIVVEREHLDILDHAIDVIREEVEGDQDMPLFSRRPR
jgi:hypothetical protein